MTFFLPLSLVAKAFRT
ncbi:hypothetical protein CI238_13480 [Colletotrichum incanum]|uniref:Uncharacterized protein n=1 Tax=Colletotrichum incanum TaxID=1573173 RepID=A0A162N1N4_COLIC|nr:hypothetical protein CI238_13480 [Colletotrichum incanum]